MKNIGIFILFVVNFFLLYGVAQANNSDFGIVHKDSGGRRFQYINKNGYFRSRGDGFWGDRDKDWLRQEDGPCLILGAKDGHAYVKSISVPTKEGWIDYSSFDGWRSQLYKTNLYLKDKLNKSNSISRINQFISEYWMSDVIPAAKLKLKKLKRNIAEKDLAKAKEKNTIGAYNIFIEKYEKAQKDLAFIAKKGIQEIAYQDALKKNSVDLYIEYVKSYPDANHIGSVLGKIYEISDKNSDIDGLTKLHRLTPESEYTDLSLSRIFNIVSKKNKVPDYEWFIKNYPQAPQIKEALQNMHQLAFDEAKKINTISAYNSFVFSYPFAYQVKDANKKAYNIEEEEYTNLGILGFFGKEGKMEKKARKLLIKAKQIARTAKDYNGEAKIGYIIVAKRMYDLLQADFDDSDATLRHLESQEFIDFVDTFKSSMNDIKRTLQKIELNTSNIKSNTSDISIYSKRIAEVAKQGFADANADRDMAEIYAQKHRDWEKFMHFMDKGYN